MYLCQYPVEYSEVKHLFDTSEVNSINYFSNELEQTIVTPDESGNHLKYAFEAQLKNAVRWGNTNAIHKILTRMSESGRIGILASHDSLRSFKNFAIITISVMIRAGLENGFDYEIAYSLNDDYVAKLEDINDISAILNYIENVLIDFAERMSLLNQRNLSPAVADIFHLIINNPALTDNVDTLADSVNLSTKYLSTLFKNELGISITKFKNLMRINNAIISIQTTDFTFAEIASQFNFSDQAHFTRTFEKFTGITPSQYKHKPNLLNTWSIEQFLQGSLVLPK